LEVEVPGIISKSIQNLQTDHKILSNKGYISQSLVCSSNQDLKFLQFFYLNQILTAKNSCSSSANTVLPPALYCGTTLCLLMSISNYLANSFLLVQGESQNLCHYVHATKNKFFFINCIHFYIVIGNGGY